MNEGAAAIQTSIAPWLSVADVPGAVTFYKAAFEAIETYRLEAPDGGLVVQLAVKNAAFWLSTATADDKHAATAPLGGGSVRMILTVSNPDELFAQAIKAGASEVFPVGEEYGWRLGRVVDPFGLHWEIGHPVE